MVLFSIRPSSRQAAPRASGAAGGSSRTTVQPAPGADRTRTCAPMRCARSCMMRRPTGLRARGIGGVEAGARPTPRSASAARAARAAPHGARRRACARWTALPAGCSTCTCTSAASGTPWPSMVRRVDSPAWCSNFCSVARSAGSMSRLAGARAEVHQQLAHVGVAFAHARVEFLHGAPHGGRVPAARPGAAAAPGSS